MAIADATKLIVYNKALRILGERKLGNTSEARPPRYLLDDVWNEGGINFCLEQGMWVFATRSIKLPSTPSIVPGFGYNNGFVKPTDFIKTVALCSDEYFNSPLTQYSDEAGYWFSDCDPLYIKYVSKDDNYGYNSTIWPQTFIKFVASYFASEICERLTQNNTKLGDVLKIMEMNLNDARSKDALAKPTQFPPTGNWTNARMGSSTRDRGNRGQLIG